MKVVGLITEYNPFHNGHLFHLQQAKKIAGADAAVSVMSGSFLQRGEPALFNKWARAAMAVSNGVDLVLELPTAFAVRGATTFAYGGVNTLIKTGIISHLCFGSELGEIEPLTELAEILTDEPPALKKLIKKHLAEGVILPVAQTRALEQYLKKHCDKPVLAEYIASPNNVLGIEYIKSLIKAKSSIIPITFKRQKTQYHQKEFAGNIASATGIRETLQERGGDLKAIEKVIPPPTLDIMKREIEAGRGPVWVDNLSIPILSKLRSASAEELSRIDDVVEGLEHRIIKMSKKAKNFTELVELVKSKRYTWTRIQRILIHFFLGYTRDMAVNFDQRGIQYIRILGFSEKGKKLLAMMRKKAQVPVITRVAPFIKRDHPGKNMILLDCLATDLYTMLYPDMNQRIGGLDYCQLPASWPATYPVEKAICKLKPPVFPSTSKISPAK